MPSVLLVCLINLVFYARTIRFGLVIDDDGMQGHWKTRHGLKDWPLRFYGHSGLPNPIEHTITLALHTLTACLVLIWSHSLVAALIYCVHPCAHQTAMWINARRYSIINIIFLTVLITHAWFVGILLLALLVRWAAPRYWSRRHLPYVPYTAHSTLASLGVCLRKLLGFYRPLGINPRCDLASLPVPFAQPTAERYLTLLLIALCPILAQMPYLVVYYCVLTWSVQPMYRNIQAFYDYHRNYIPQDNQKLVLLRKIYPVIVETQNCE